MNKQNQNIKLQVLICTLGEAGIKRIVEAHHPNVPEVEYLVSWQLPDGDVEIPEELERRRDFKVFKNNTRGLSKNRNIALSLATAPYCLISDDDLDYSEDGLLRIIRKFEDNPQLDIATFKYSGNDRKFYPDYSFDLRKPPKGYFVTSFEIAFRRNKIIKSEIKFNENFGIGAKFPAGEEDIWLHDLLRKRFIGRFFPIIIAHHEGLTTGLRLDGDPALIITKGAVFIHIYKWTWLLRMLIHAYRQCRNDGNFTMFQYCQIWMKGALKATKHTFTNLNNKIHFKKESTIKTL
jgi:hypothetical protein